MSTSELAKAAKDRGNAAYSAGNIDQAIKEFTVAIELDPTDAVFWSNRSMCYASKNDFPLALQDAQKCIDLRPDWPKAYSRAGLALYKLGRFTEAKEVYEKGLKIAPNDANLKEGLEETNNAMTPKEDPMMKLFGPQMWDRLRANPRTRALADDPQVKAKLALLQANPQLLGSFMNDPKLTACIGAILGLPEDVFMANGDGKMNVDDEDSSSKPAKSEQSKTKPGPAPEPEPEREMTEEELKAADVKRRATAEKDKGNDLFSKRKFDEALEFYNRAIEIDPTECTFYSNRAAVYLHKKDYERTIEEYKKAIEVGKEHRADYISISKIWFRLGQAYQAQDKLADAIAAYEKSLIEHRDSKVEKALKEVKALLKKREEEAYINPELSEEHKKKGNEYFQEGKWPEAIHEYTEALRRDPKNYKVLSNRALCYTKVMDWQKGLDDCEAILKIDPKFVKAYIRKGKIQQFLKQYHKALDTFKQGLDLDPTNSELLQAKQETMMAISRDMSSDQADPERAKEALKDPEIQRILRDPTINKVLQDMQSDPKVGQKALRDPDVASKIEKLIAAGILRIG